MLLSVASTRAREPQKFNFWVVRLGCVQGTQSGCSFRKDGKLRKVPFSGFCLHPLALHSPQKCQVCKTSACIIHNQSGIASGRPFVRWARAQSALKQRKHADICCNVFMQRPGAPWRAQVRSATVSQLAGVSTEAVLPVWARAAAQRHTQAQAEVPAQLLLLTNSLPAEDERNTCSQHLISERRPNA